MEVFARRRLIGLVHSVFEVVSRPLIVLGVVHESVAGFVLLGSQSIAPDRGKSVGIEGFSRRGAADAAGLKDVRDGVRRSIAPKVTGNARIALIGKHALRRRRIASIAMERGQVIVHGCKRSLRIDREHA